MLVAFVLFVASGSGRNPTLIGGDTARPSRGVQRVTPHPMSWSFALWARVHVIERGHCVLRRFPGDGARRHAIDRRQAGAALPGDLAGTVGRNLHRAVRRNCGGRIPREMGWRGPLIGVVAWAVVLFLHPWLFGVAPVVM